MEYSDFSSWVRRSCSNNSSYVAYQPLPAVLEGTSLAVTRRHVSGGEYNVIVTEYQFWWTSLHYSLFIAVMTIWLTSRLDTCPQCRLQPEVAAADYVSAPKRIYHWMIVLERPCVMRVTRKFRVQSKNKHNTMLSLRGFIVGWCRRNTLSLYISDKRLTNLFTEQLPTGLNWLLILII